MEALVAKKRNESQMLLKKTSPFPPSPVIIWVQQGTHTMLISSAKEEQMLLNMNNILWFIVLDHF